MKAKPNPDANKLPPNPLPLPGIVTLAAKVEVEERTERAGPPSRMGPGEIPLTEGRFKMPWHMMWDDGPDNFHAADS